MKNFLGILALGAGISLGAGILYALYTSETARLLAMFLFGALLFGGVVLVTVLLVNRQWTRSLEQQRITNHYRLEPPGGPGWAQPYGQQPAGYLPPPPPAYNWNGTGPGATMEDDGEAVA